ncbi:golgin candidate 1 isoform X2 [Hevea brasiliensis]|uniref:golgin candidate 1 isoform X2 n=1 Tax=Hevea brasiliensis TaxID=3981 RepID=UPI0025D864D2|nr:golgin candidate 1 isoform X2 [Hevea brasiliensis]
MASWLKAAEDLFEVVDRRAKLVVSELSDEHADSQSPASNGQGSQPRRAKSKTRARKRLSTNESYQASNTTGELSNTQTSKLDVISDIDRNTLSVENDATPSSQSILQTLTEQQQNTDRGVSSIASSERLANEVVKDNAYHVEVPVTAADAEAATSTSNGELLNEKDSDVPVELVPSPLPAKEIEILNEDHQDHPFDADIKLRDAVVSSNIDQERSQLAITDPPVNGETSVKGADLRAEPLVDQQNHQQQSKADTSLMKIQDQLDEAQGLLKTAISTGQSKEARLARVCAGLSTRLQEYKSENAQLEELLIAERELSRSYEARIKQLQQNLSTSKSEMTRVESNMAEALAAKNSEIEALVNSMDTLKKQATLSEGNLASMQANMESIMRNRELTETRMMQAVREELASTERRAEEERAAHNATKMAAMEREVELEHRAVEASTALARVQRIADERTTKAAELEQKVALLEVECASLNQELQDMEARARRSQKKSPEEANQVIQAWQEEVERARQGQRDAESKLSSMEAEVQKMRVEMSAMKRDAEHYSRQEHMELEKRYRELTDLLYYKQTQLEAMASEKAAAEFQLEKEVKRLQEAQVEAERGRVSRHASSSWDEDSEMKSLEYAVSIPTKPLPLHHRHMAAATMQLQKAAKLLDSGAARATRFLWRYPTARLILLFYLVFVHLFLMYLLHRLQEQADNLSAREVAESMGLANPTLP